MRSFSWFPILLALVACKSSTESTVGSDQPQEETELSRLMKEHSEHGVAMREAIIRAELPDVREHANWVLKHMDDPALPEEWQKFKPAMKDAAERAAFSVDVDVTAQAVADIGSVCGSCHSELGQGPDVKVPKPPADDASLEVRMMRHHWAAERLWDGLVAPSDEAWKTGAEVLTAAPMTVDKINLMGSEADVERLMNEVHTIAKQSAGYSTQTERAKAMGGFLTRCGKCHTLFGKGRP